MSKSGIAEAVLNLTRLEAEQRHPEDGLRCGTLWLATAALTVLHRLVYNWMLIEKFILYSFIKWIRRDDHGKDGWDEWKDLMDVMDKN